MHQKENPVAVFDSGMGGVSVLRELYKLLPHENFLFFGDSAHAPYGTKTTEEVRTRTMEAVKSFRERNAKAVVIACNTATSAAIRQLRELYPDMPLVGLEPAVKPAALENQGKRIVVMATPLTLRKEKFRRLVQKYESMAQFCMAPAPELVELIEQGKTGTKEIQDYLRRILEAYITQPAAAVVLGCTHFPFAQKDIKEALGDHVKFYDGGAGASRELKRQLEQMSLLNDSETPGNILFENSDESGVHQAMSRRLFELPD